MTRKISLPPSRNGHLISRNVQGCKRRGLCSAFHMLHIKYTKPLTEVARLPLSYSNWKSGSLSLSNVLFMLLCKKTQCCISMTLCSFLRAKYINAHDMIWSWSCFFRVIWIFMFFTGKALSILHSFRKQTNSFQPCVNMMPNNPPFKYFYTVSLKSKYRCKYWWLYHTRIHCRILSGKGSWSTKSTLRRHFLTTDMHLPCRDRYLHVRRPSSSSVSVAVELIMG